MGKFAAAHRVCAGRPSPGAHFAGRPHQTRINTVIIAIITTNLNLAGAPGNVLLPATDCGLSRDSVVNVSQLVTLNKYDLTEFVGTIPEQTMARVEEGLKLVLGLD